MQPGQFTLRRSFVAIALIALGCFGITLLLPGRYAATVHSDGFKLVACLCIWGSLIWIGAGVGLLLDRWREGAVIGGLLELIIVNAYMFFWFPA
jgi:hypothetical protein